MCVCVVRVLTAGCVGVWVGTLWDKYTVHCVQYKHDGVTVCKIVCVYFMCGMDSCVDVSLCVCA